LVQSVSSNETQFMCFHESDAIDLIDFGSTAFDS